MDRLARNLDDLRKLVQTLTRRGIQVEFVQEHMVFTATDDPMAQLLLSLIGALRNLNGPSFGNANAKGSPWPNNAGLIAVARRP